jgi:hypothetical protein
MSGQVNNSVQITNDGFFMVDGEKFDLGQLMMELQLDMTTQIDRQIADQMAEIKDRNEELSNLNDLLASMRKFKEEGKDDDTGTTVTIGEETKTMWRGDDSWADEYGIEWTDINGGASSATQQKQWDANIEAVKGKIDSLNSESQLDMIRLQSLMDKRNQRYEQASNTLQKDQKTRDTIVGNTR